MGKMQEKITVEVGVDSAPNGAESEASGVSNDEKAAAAGEEGA